jgi:hypothetical protein
MRLNEVVGPENWFLDPYGHDDHEMPLIGRGRDGEFWVKLTILGVTKMEVATNYASVQEALGDGLRRAAMRFGIGTYLWSKSEAAANMKAGLLPDPEPPSTQDALDELDRLAAEAGTTREILTAKWRTENGNLPMEALPLMSSSALIPLVQAIRAYLETHPPA